MDLEKRLKVKELRKKINELSSIESNFQDYDNIINTYRTERMNKELELNTLMEEFYSETIKVDEKHYLIEIKDSTKNLKRWVGCLEQSISKGDCPEMLKENIQNLENISEMDPTANYTFPSNERIYYSKERIKYIPNAHSKEEKSRIFKQMKRNLKLTKLLFENGYSVFGGSIW